MSSERSRRCSCSCGGASSISVTVFTVSSSSLPEICSYSRTTFCHSDSLSMYSASEPALFRRGCVGSLQQSHLPASVRGPVLSIKFSECLSSVTAFCFHDQAQRSVLDAAHDDRVQHEIGLLSLLVWQEIGQHVWRRASRHFACNFSDTWVKCCEIRNELEAPLVVSSFFSTIEARWTTQVSRIQDHQDPPDTSANRITAPQPHKDETPT